MSLSQALLPEYDQEMAKTRTVLERVPADRFGWKPHEKSFSFLELSNHIARLPGWGSATVEMESLDLAPDGGQYEPPPPAESPEGVLELFDETAAAFRTALEGADDATLMQPWTLYSGGEELFTLPRMAVLRGMILNHIIHHRAQLAVYLRLSDIPVPAIYGPSADEGMG
ncbi:DinB family protein [Gemmatimonadota bacterium]